MVLSKNMSSFITKFTVVLVATLVGLLLSTAAQAAAWSLRYENTKHSFSAIYGNQYCNFDYYFGEAFSTAYSKVRVTGNSWGTPCYFGIQAHTTGSTPAGQECWNFFTSGCNSSQLAQGWYQSQSIAYTTHHYTDITIQIGNGGPGTSWHDFRVYSNIGSNQNQSHGYTYADWDGNLAGFCADYETVTGEDYCFVL